MGRIYFKATKDNKGFSTTVYSLVTKDEKGKLDARFVFTFQKQTGWNEKTRTGQFAKGRRFNVTFNLFEIGEIASLIRTRQNPFHLYHGTDKGVTTGIFDFKEKEVDKGRRLTKVGAITIYVKQGENTISTSLTTGEADDLLAYIGHCRNLIYAQLDAAEAKDRATVRSQTPLEAPHEDAEVPPEDGGLQF